MNICLREEPPLTEFEKEHTASCWIYHPMAPKVENGFKAEVSISGSKE